MDIEGMSDEHKRILTQVYEELKERDIAKDYFIKNGLYDKSNKDMFIKDGTSGIYFLRYKSHVVACCRVKEGKAAGVYNSR